MVEWAATEDRVCGFGEFGTATLRVDGWLPGGNAPSLGVGVDACVVGTTTAIQLPTPDAMLATGERPLQPGRLPRGRIRATSIPGLDVTVAFDAPALVSSAGAVRIEFDEPTPVAVGFREDRPPRHAVRVPPTPTGLASAVTAAGHTLQADGPERSHPGFRPRTPRVVFEETADPETSPGPVDLTVTVPDSMQAVLVAAPLAYYLSAEMRVGDGPPRVGGTEVEHTFGTSASFADEVAMTLRLLCHLDTRLRSIPGETELCPADGETELCPADGETTLPVGETEPTPAVDGRDPTDLRSAPVARRLQAVLESSYRNAMVPSLPTWPLATYVDDDVENGRYLPYLLDRLSLVFPASASSLDPRTFLRRSLDGFYRGDAATLDPVDPALADARYHAWLGDGTPVDAYTLVGSPTSRPGFADRLRVHVVCNDPEMGRERDAAATYRRHLGDFGATVRIHERLSTAELAALFGGESDLVHFIGHCETDGLVCHDGLLATVELERCGADAFVLNACGSCYEGYDLVRRGATVGVVTMKPVLEEQAMTFGRTFAGLLAAGFAFDRALSLARGEIIVGRDYTTVGDGTHRLRPPRGRAAVLDVESGTDGFAVRYDVLSPDSAGRRYVGPFDGRERACGTDAVARLDRLDLVELLDRFPVPVRYNGRFDRPEHLAEALSRDDTAA